MHRALAIEIRHPPRPHRSQLPRDEPGDDGSDGGQSRGIERHRDASTYAHVSIAVLALPRPISSCLLISGLKVRVLRGALFHRPRLCRGLCSS